ncbi:siderophore ABC transporter substrate-binding protein [Enemella evansiae]|uniref:siderophore ABC transporter substrate-binding protein n=1 Tax=Enemella evansiae TaxID=2016499 RepID=UPI000C0107C5|nr:ABC transporter substrate-binding protein [Enemella evansiae]PFG67316.1 iron complex transport system substrate-binding protein [Propionibacteriaceae bacterium ES.041]
MTRLMSLLALIGVLLLSACGQSTGSNAAGGAETQTITHAQGSTELKGSPQRIAVLDFGALDTIKALGFADRVVGLPKQALPGFLGEFRDEKYTDLGTLQEPNLEALNQAKPDLVVIGFRSAKKYPELTKFWPTIDVTYPQELDFVEGNAKAAGIIGQALGATDAVNTRIEALRQRADALKPAAAQAGRGLIVMTSAGKVTLQGPASRFGIIHSRLGVPQAVDGIENISHGQPVSFEQLAQANPDVLFVVDRDAAIGKEGQNAMQVLDNELVRGTNAWRNQKVIQLDGGRWYIAMHGLANAEAQLAELEQGLRTS